MIRHPHRRPSVISGEMTLKTIACNLKEIRACVGRSVGILLRLHSRHNAEEGQRPWAELPPELLIDIISRVEASELEWPARRQVAACAAVCRSWREITKVVLSGRITFTDSLKQPGPRDYSIKCFITRDPVTQIYRLYLGFSPDPREESNRLLLVARMVRRANRSEFLISLFPNEFSQASSAYIGKLRSNYLGTKFTVNDKQPSPETNASSSTRRFDSKQVRPRVPDSHNVATITYDLNVLGCRRPRRMQCTMHSVLISSIEEGGDSPTASVHSLDEQVSFSTDGIKDLDVDYGSTALTETPVAVQKVGEPLVLKSKVPRWNEYVRSYCLNFRGRVTKASIKNFQLEITADSSPQVPVEELGKIILQFGKTEKDIFTMDYRYPLSAFQSFAICLSSFQACN